MTAFLAKTIARRGQGAPALVRPGSIRLSTPGIPSAPHRRMIWHWMRAANGQMTGRWEPDRLPQH